MYCDVILGLMYAFKVEETDITGKLINIKDFVEVFVLSCSGLFKGFWAPSKPKRF